MFGMYVEPLNDPTFILVSDPAACREGVEEIPAKICYAEGCPQVKPSIWTKIAIQPNTDTIWMETGTHHNN